VLAAKHSNFKVCLAIASTFRTVFLLIAPAACMDAQIHYTLDRPPAGWSQGVGFISAEMVCGGWRCIIRAARVQTHASGFLAAQVKAHLPPPGKGTQARTCTLSHDWCFHMRSCAKCALVPCRFLCAAHRP
jgi:hypothetical protein